MTLLLAPGIVLLAVFVSTNVALLPYMQADEQRVFQLGALLLIVVLSLTVPAVRHPTLAILRESPRAVWAALLFLALGVASSLGSLLPAAAVLEVAMHGLLAWLVMTIAAGVRSAPREVSGFILIGLAAVLIIYSIGYLALPDLTPRGVGLWARGPRGGFSNPRYLGQLLVLTVPAASALSLAPRVPWLVRATAGISAAAGWWAMVLTGERGAPLAMAGAGLLVCFVVMRRSSGARRYGRHHLLLGAAGLAAGALTRILLVLGQGGALTLDAVVNRDATTSSGRLLLWQHAMDLAADHPWLGIGPGHYAHVEYLLAPQSPASPHNLPLKLAAEWGMPATAVAGSLAVLGLLVVLRRAPSAAAIEELGLTGVQVTTVALVTVGSGLALSLVSGVGSTAIGQTLLALTIGWLVGLYLQPPASSRRGGSAAVRLPIAVVLAATVPVGTTLVTTSPGDLRTSETQALAREGAGALQPRFWTQGVIGLESDDGVSASADS